jgi:protein-S-isoprenylcysteine O-methyltransferase Ste14
MPLPRMLVSALIFTVVAAGLIFGLAGRWDVWNVWAYVGVHFVSLSLNTLAIYVHSPDVLKERDRPAAPGRAGWTGYPSLVVFLLMQWGLAGLDQRFHWSDLVPPAGVVAGLVICVIGWGLITWATWVNPFFSSAVRMQADRGQRVISEGPYSIVRHPGYVGPLLDAVGGGLALNSLLSLLPIVVILLPVTVYRTMIEDRMLHDELAGYTDYAAKVRYRLIPGLW